MPDPNRHSDAYDPDPDWDRPTRAEAEADEWDGEEEYDGPGTCWICDGVGHAYIVGWRDDPHKGRVPIIGGGPCPIEEPGGWEPDDEDLPF